MNFEKFYQTNSVYLTKFFDITFYKSIDIWIMSRTNLILLLKPVLLF